MQHDADALTESLRRNLKGDVASQRAHQPEARRLLSGNSAFERGELGSLIRHLDDQVLRLIQEQHQQDLTRADMLHGVLHQLRHDTKRNSAIPSPSRHRQPGLSMQPGQPRGA
ncbi:hypothetical protein AQJ67_09830 [Streptomyces caeruleatus]|uniref:Uncharacterized protein n=1 Tax=Streptomyces caeruleatus TaxID=661399 RepID=A0A101U6B4_9ACTN|nr:hypothetical protein AQJ67_09830 [Streptomyces caeruleatus]